MPGAMRKLGLYLGLVEDDEDGRDRRHEDDLDDDEGYVDEHDDAAPRRPRSALGAERGRTTRAPRARAGPRRPAAPSRSTPACVPRPPRRRPVPHHHACTRAPTTRRAPSASTSATARR
jgi:hypothetical protein